MHVTCPCCQESFPIEAGFLDADGKRLAALLAGMDPALGRAVLGYLRLFKPAKHGLRTARAVKLTAELAALVEAGDVCRDERGGVRRAATPAMWAQGIEQMLQQRDKLTLPLANHHYLRAIVYGLADGADAQAERDRETALRQGARATPAKAAPVEDKLTSELRFIAQLHAYGSIEDDERDRRTAAAREKFGHDTQVNRTNPQG